LLECLFWGDYGWRNNHWRDNRDNWRNDNSGLSDNMRLSYWAFAKELAKQAAL
jgi:hypothetical protein